MRKFITLLVLAAFALPAFAKTYELIRVMRLDDTGGSGVACFYSNGEVITNRNGICAPTIDRVLM